MQSPGGRKRESLVPAQAFPLKTGMFRAKAVPPSLLRTLSSAPVFLYAKELSRFANASWNFGVTFAIVSAVIPKRSITGSGIDVS